MIWFISDLICIAVISWGLWHLARAIVRHHEHRLWSRRCDKYERWLKDYEENKDSMTPEEKETVLTYLKDVLDGKNKEMRGPWEKLP